MNTPSEEPKSTTTDEEITAEDLLRPDFLPTYNQARSALNKIKPITSITSWGDLLAGNHIFEVLNRDHLEMLTNYLAQRIEEIAPDNNDPVTILEIGAGRGRLSHFLRQMLDEKAPGKARVIATDSYEDQFEPDYDVEKIDHIGALDKYKPEIVICSWMPYETDLSKAIRMSSNVKEYILIGEDDSGSCGHEIETWGYVSLYDQQRHGVKPITPPYISDGFTRVNHPEWTRSQLSAADDGFSQYHSRTVSFIRGEKK